jgi:hypothetical protein
MIVLYTLQRGLSFGFSGDYPQSGLFWREINAGLIQNPCLKLDMPATQQV